MDIAFWQFSNNPPNSDHMPDAMTFLIILHSTCTGPFSGYIACIGVFGFGYRKIYPPVLLRTYGSSMWDEFEYMWRIILILLYSVIASGCVTL